ncbi:unnamed protein product [Citrullus colocynthis]|uniref:Uncharacterized protein n=1 Tax=Citrullus colocynthis TaxID=252529 RepID=A0ABP0YKV8_9ROSI
MAEVGDTLSILKGRRKRIRRKNKLISSEMFFNFIFSLLKKVFGLMGFLFHSKVCIFVPLSLKGCNFCFTSSRESMKSESKMHRIWCFFFFSLKEMAYWVLLETSLVTDFRALLCF